LGRDKWGLSRVKASAGTRPRSMAALWFRNFPLAYCSLLKTRLTTLILDETLTRLRRRSAACGARWDAHNRTAVRAAQRRLRGRLTPPPPSRNDLLFARREARSRRQPVIAERDERCPKGIADRSPGSCSGSRSRRSIAWRLVGAPMGGLLRQSPLWPPAEERRFKPIEASMHRARSLFQLCSYFHKRWVDVLRDTSRTARRHRLL
jgi:hypothetical protein